MNLHEIKTITPAMIVIDGLAWIKGYRRDQRAPKTTCQDESHKGQGRYATYAGEHHECAKRALGAEETFYCTCPNHGHNDEADWFHYFEVTNGTICTPCLTRNCPVPPE